jgi:16S rRNA (uracil1498-N3)-methyltransferase
VNLLLVQKRELDEDHRVRLSDRRAAHLLDVLGVRSGDVVRAGVFDGGLGEAVVIEATDGVVVLDARALLVAPRPPRPRVDVLLATPRPKVLRRLASQLACMGIGHLFLTMAARVERAYVDASALDEADLKSRFVEGLEQARDTNVPSLSIHPSLRWLVEKQLPRHEVYARHLCADVPLGERTSIREACEGLRDGERVVLAIGPEGGWLDDERALFHANGYRMVSLGDRILKSDLACISALALLNEELT